MLKHIEKNVDYLLLEGTTLGRTKGKFLPETAIEEKLIALFRKNTGINLIYTSGQNIDRLISIYNACKETKKTMAIDFYLANVMKEMAFYDDIPFTMAHCQALVRQGYLFEERTKAFVEYLLSRGLTEHHLHTSGHADVETLKRLVDAIQPKTLVPIHTFEGGSYQKIFTNVNVRQVKDKEIVEI